MNIQATEIFVGAIGNPPIVLPIADTVLAAYIDAMIVRF